MNLFINNTSGIPLYEQLVQQIQNHIIAGTLKKDEPMPSMRMLASDLHISVITTKRAYEELARAGFLYSVPAKGYFVARIDRHTIIQQVYTTVSEHLEAACSEAAKIGLPNKELHRLLDSTAAGNHKK